MSDSEITIPESICQPHRRITNKGYVQVRLPKHPRANTNGYIFEHILVIEKIIGKPYPKGVVTHHVNGNKADNRPKNLVLCQNQGYHKLLHRRMKALVASGHANWRRCRYCKEYDDPQNMVQDGYKVHHKSCRNTMDRNKRRIGGPRMNSVTPLIG